VKAFLGLFLILLSLVACNSDSDTQCPDLDPSLCDFASELEQAMKSGGVDFLMNRLVASIYTCPIDVLGVEPCRGEPDGSEVTRVGHEIAVTGDRPAAQSLVSPERLARILADLIQAVRPGERDAMGSGAARLYAVGRHSQSDQVSILLTAIVSLPPVMPNNRLALSFE
jgi:hypothetical protein